LQADPRGVREQLGTQPGAVVCLTVARLVAGKGHELLLQAFARLASRFPELDLWFAGDGPELEALRARAEGLGVAARVQFLGFRRDVPRLLRAADLLCHPSRKEGAPNSVREAMAAGLPVAAVAASGTPELMVEGETGFLSPVDDVPKLAANLERLVSSRELRARMGEAGRRRALAEFSENVCTERWLALLESCLQEKPATPGR
jgi:glycosyltransferase involved in cell wall biosynthesis